MDLSSETQTLVIVGNGMVGFKLCQRMVEYGANDEIRIVVFGEEPRPAYDRVHLTELFSGRPSASLGLVPDNWYEHNGIELYLDDPVVDIDRERSIVRSSSGRVVAYNRLVFATGSRPFVPPIEGSKLYGCFTYRTVDDVYEIEDHAIDAKSAAVIGGGLLGLEAAKAVFDLGLTVHVVESAKWPMPKQLDAQGGAVLRDKIEKLGVKFHGGKKLLRIEAVTDQDGEDTGQRRLVFADGPPLEVGMVVFSAGIRPRGDLARSAGLAMSEAGGIIVDDRMQTTDPQIYAVGECASHRGICYGLVVPGYQQVDVLAANLVGGEQLFQGADISAKLKLMGVTVAALGEHDGDQRLGGNALVFDGGGVYRKLVVRNGRLIGAVTVGDWDNLDRIRELLKAPLPLSFWDMRRFRGTGNLWPKSESAPVTEWPAEAVVCGCLRVTRGSIDAAIAEGCCSVEEVSSRTRAGTLCGSCKPLISELLGLEGPPSLLEGGPISRFEQAPRSRREGPRSRRDGARSRRDFAPSSRLESSHHTPSATPSSSLEDSNRSRRDAAPSSLDPDLAPPSVRTLAPPSRRVAIAIADQPNVQQSSLLGLVSLGKTAQPPPPAADDDVEPAPMSRRGHALHDVHDDEPAPMSMRGATLSSRDGHELSPATVRSSLPPPPAVPVPVSAPRAAPLPLLQAQASSSTQATIEAAPATPRVAENAPQTSRSSEAPTTAQTGAAPADAAPDTSKAAQPPPSTAREATGVSTPKTLPPPRVLDADKPPLSSRRVAQVDVVQMGPASTRTPLPAVVAATLSTRDIAPASVGPRSARAPVRVAVVDLDEAPPTPDAVSARVSTKPQSSPSPSSKRPPSLDERVERGPQSDIPPTSRRSAVLVPAPPLLPTIPIQDGPPSRPRSVPPPRAQIAILEAPSSSKRMSAAPFELEDALASQQPGVVPRDDLAEETDHDPDSTSASPPRLSWIGSVDEGEIADILSMPRDSVLPHADRAPMSRRSWVPPKRLSIPPGALSMSAPPPNVKPAPAPVPVERGRSPLLVASVIGVVLVVLFAAVPSLPPARSLRGGTFVQAMLRSDLARQVTGYALVGTTLLSLGISLRKRWQRFSYGDVGLWRAAHAIVMAASLVLLFFHTGLSAGSRLNLVLFVDFLAATVLGAVAGLLVVFSNRFTPLVARNRRLRSAFAHILLTWPLPILVTLHVIAVYYF